MWSIHVYMNIAINLCMTLMYHSYRIKYDFVSIKKQICRHFRFYQYLLFSSAKLEENQLFFCMALISKTLVHLQWKCMLLHDQKKRQWRISKFLDSSESINSAVLSNITLDLELCVSSWLHELNYCYTVNKNIL